MAGHIAPTVRKPRQVVMLSLRSPFKSVPALSVYPIQSRSPLFVYALYIQRFVSIVFINPVIKLTEKINRYNLQTLLDGLPCSSRDNTEYLLRLL